MPRFIQNGPDIPERLLHAHEEGKVVFFCGAGISQPTGLPNFKGLVQELCKRLPSVSSNVQKQAINEKQYDKAVELLEKHYINGRTGVREYIAQILTPNLASPKDIAAHDALLRLAENREKKIRLVTTNFDRVFEEVIKNKNKKIDRFSAPLLPIPKNRWDGLVYLHGLLPELNQIKEESLEHLVVSSGDYGLAYLSERWAARFVSELFRNYTVCFVGYGLNDPVISYMADALAADKLRGESSLEMFSFAGYDENEKQQVSEQWEAKNVTPILYQKTEGHSYLYQTLNEWSKDYRDGMYNKTRIISSYAAPPSLLSSSQLDISVEQVLWAITDVDAAKHFAEMNPAPPIEWLWVFSEKKLGHKDLERFGIMPNTEIDDKLEFTIMSRPAPYTHSSQMSVSDKGEQGSPWDDIMLQLAHWMTRHLNEPKLVFWLTNEGGYLNNLFVRLVYKQIEYIGRLENESHKDKSQKHILQKIQQDSPNAVPNTLMQTVWSLMLAGRFMPQIITLHFHEWYSHFCQEGLTYNLRIEFIKFLTPYIKINNIVDNHSDDSKHIKDIFRCEIALSLHDFSYDMLGNLENDEGCNTMWTKVLPELLQDFSKLLRDICDLKQMLGSADNLSDHSFLDRPSISKHPANNDYRDWTILIDLICEAWLATVSTNPKRAKRIAEDWWDTPYPLFKRLAFFAAANSSLITSVEVVDWLLADKCEWLWSLDTYREVLRLLVAISPKLDKQLMERIEDAILKGSTREPKNLYLSNVDTTGKNAEIRSPHK